MPNTALVIIAPPPKKKKIMPLRLFHNLPIIFFHIILHEYQTYSLSINDCIIVGLHVLGSKAILGIYLCIL